MNFYSKVHEQLKAINTLIERILLKLMRSEFIGVLWAVDKGDMEVG